MKKTICLILAVVLVLSISACNTTTGTDNTISTTVPSTQPTTEQTTEPQTEPTTEPTVEPPTELTTEPTTEPPMELPSEPTTEPTTAPTDEPTTEPTSVPTTTPAATTHAHYYGESQYDPTCTEKGYTVYWCECGYSYADNYVDALGHNYKTEVIAPTIYDQGYTLYTCIVCDYKYEDNFTEPLATEPPTGTPNCSVNGHAWKEDPAGSQKPNCLVEGFTYYVCTVCGETWTEHLGLGDHNYGEWRGKAPTCTEEGREQRQCSYAACQHIEYRSSEALGHDYTSTVIEPTDKSEGYTLYTCSRCSNSYKDNYIEKLPPIAISGISLSESSASLTIGDALTLYFTISPSNATNCSVSWSSSDNSVAQVDSSGRVTAIGAGTAIITITTEDGGHFASCQVTVQEPPLEVSISMGLSFYASDSGSVQGVFAEINPIGGSGNYVACSIVIYYNGEYVGEENSTSIVVTPIQAGTYTAEVYVRDSSGNEITASKSFTVS